MSLNSNQTKKLCFCLLQSGKITMLKISKWLPKAESSRAPERAKDHAERIELTIAAKMVKREASKREPPALALRPIKHNGALAKMRQHLLLNVVMPNRAIRIDKQNIAPAQTPPDPNAQVKANGGEQID